VDVDVVVLYGITCFKAGGGKWTKNDRKWTKNDRKWTKNDQNGRTSHSPLYSIRVPAGQMVIWKEGELFGGGGKGGKWTKNDRKWTKNDRKLTKNDRKWTKNDRKWTKKA